MVPDFGGLIWMVIALIEAIVFISAALAFIFWFMPPIARRFIRIKWSKGSPAFIQHAGRVFLFSSSEELPEGVIRNKMGWFLKSVTPYKGEPAQQKRKPGRPPKTPEKLPEGTSMDDINEAIEISLRTPILEGLGKQVFFGSSDTPLLSNLETISAMSEQQTMSNGGKKEAKGGIRHAVLSALREVIPATMARSQLDALATFNYLRGLKVRGGDMIKLVIVCVAVIGVVATVGLVFYFLTQGGGA